MRSRFDQQLDQLNLELITMGAMCEEAIGLTAGALVRSEAVQRRPIDQLEQRIDQT